MVFNQIVSEKLYSLFTEDGLNMIEESKNMVKYESDQLIVLLSHNPRENSNALFVGRKGNEVEMDNQVMREHFNSDINLENLSLETFVNNVYQFFIGEGKKLLEGSERALVGLEDFNLQRSLEYTTHLVEQQIFEAANKAWKKENYSDVIKFLDKVNKANLPSPFMKKYKIAQQKLNR